MTLGTLPYRWRASRVVAWREPAGAYVRRVYLLAPPWSHLPWSSMDFFVVRRARLRPEYARLYPRLVADLWLGARSAVRTVRRSDLKARQREQQGERILPDGHFEFRGGKREDRPSGVLSRSSDRSAAQSRREPCVNRLL